MELNSFMESYANEIGGQYSEYDSSKSVIIVPLPDGRFQTVFGVLTDSEKYKNRTGIEFTSRVCEYENGIDLKQLLEANADFCHAKFVIHEGYLKVEASAFTDTATEPLLKEIIQEVALTADEWEMKLTGMDVH